MIYILFLLFTLMILAIAFYQWQYFMIFRPTYYREGILDDKYELLSINTTDGVELEGVVYEPENPRATLLFFAGRSHDSVGLIERLSKHYNDIRIVTFNYRSYGKSKGKASEENFLSDGELIAMKVQKYYGDFSVVGFSIGSSVAAYVASKQKVKALFLIGAFDSLASLAKKSYGFISEKLFRYRFDTQQFVTEVDAPTYLFVSKSDETIAIENARALRKKIKNLVYYKEYNELSHKELLWEDEIINRIKEAL